MNRLFQGAFSAAKRVRNETQIAERPVSVARVGVDLAKQIFEDLSRKTALLVGAGEMVEMALRALRGEGLEAIRVANRTLLRAERLANDFAGTAHSLSELPALIGEADVVLTSVGGDTPVITLADLESQLLVRRDRPLFIIDLGVPRNVDPRLAELDNVFVYDIDDLGSVASDNAELRQREARRAEELVLEEGQRFEGWMTALRAVPTIQHLRARAEEIRNREVERALARPGLAADQREAVEALTRSIVNKILHHPVSRLRSEADREEGMLYLEAARVLFGLDESEEGDRDADDTRSDPSDA